MAAFFPGTVILMPGLMLLASEKNHQVVRVFHVITSLDTGGAEMMLYKLLSTMDPSASEHRVVCLLPFGNVATKISSLGVPVWTLNMKHGVPSLKKLLQLIRLIREWKPDIVQTWMYHADLFGLVAAKLACRGRVIWNIRCSNMDLRHYSKTTRFTVAACRVFSPFPDGIITNSETAKRYHLQLGYRPRSMTVIPNGFDLNRFRPDAGIRKKIRSGLGLTDQDMLVGHIGRLDPMKDHLTFFQAANRLNEKYPQVQFLLCGKGIDRENETMRGFLSGMRIPSNFHLLGPRQDIHHLMTSLDILVSSSAWGEGFPNVIGEAMACGVPCVVTDVGDSARIVGNTGKVVRPTAPLQLADAVAKLIELPESSRISLGEAARHRVAEVYAIERIADLYQQLYMAISRHRSFGNM